jgi:hypothetical protein
MRRLHSFLPTLFLCAPLCACGGRVTGHTYHNNGGVVQVEFKSGGKALVSAGPVTHTCSYSESGKAVSLVCEDDITNLSMQDDGALVGPSDGLMARLTPVGN